MILLYLKLHSDRSKEAFIFTDNIVCCETEDKHLLFAVSSECLKQEQLLTGPAGTEVYKETSLTPIPNLTTKLSTLFVNFM